MVRPVTHAGSGNWKALLALAVIAGGLIWHVLACVESPMAFSPNGKDLAFTTVEPYGPEKVALTGTHVYRLMILTETKPLRTLEETSAEMLCAPAWSPDGKQVAYLRIPLFTEARIEKLKEEAQKRQDLAKQAEMLGQEAEAAAPPAGAAPGAKPAEAAAQKPESTEDVSLPPLGDAVTFARNTAAYSDVRAQLVVRDAKTGDVVSVTALDAPLGEIKDEALLMLYATFRPQYDAEGRWIYVRAGNLLLAVDPAERKQRIVAAPVDVAALSPDGSIMATVQSSALGLIRTDGSSALYRRWKTDNASLSGVAWMDKNTLALLRLEKVEGAADGKQQVTVFLDLVKSDGTPEKPIEIKVPPFTPTEGASGELAIAPSGKSMVLCFARDVFFLKPDGKVVGTWHGDADKGPEIADPTFTPDSKRVAFKKMVKEGEALRAAGIVFFSPEGKEEAAADIPAAKIPTPPAEKPAEKPAAKK